MLLRIVMHQLPCPLHHACHAMTRPQHAMTGHQHAITGHAICMTGHAICAPTHIDTSVTIVLTCPQVMADPDLAGMMTNPKVRACVFSFADRNMADLYPADYLVSIACPLACRVPCAGCLLPGQCQALLRL